MLVKHLEHTWSETCLLSWIRLWKSVSVQFVCIFLPHPLCKGSASLIIARSVCASVVH